MFYPTGYSGPADGFHKYGTGPFPQYTAEDYQKQERESPNPFSTGGIFDDKTKLPKLKKLLGDLDGSPTPQPSEDSFEFDQPIYDPSVKPPSEPMDINEQYQKMMDLARQQFNQNRFQQPRPFMGQMGGMFGLPFGGMMGGYGSPFGGLGMFGMSPYGGYGGHGMFGGMMSPFMGGMFGRSGRGQMFQQQPTQQPFQQLPSFGGNNMMQNPFMGGLGSMFGNMFGGGMTQNVPNTQANVSQ